MCDTARGHSGKCRFIGVFRDRLDDGTDFVGIFRGDLLKLGFDVFAVGLHALQLMQIAGGQ